MLIRIYVGSRYGGIYHSAFLPENQYTLERKLNLKATRRRWGLLITLCSCFAAILELYNDLKKRDVSLTDYLNKGGKKSFSFYYIDDNEIGVVENPM